MVWVIKPHPQNLHKSAIAYLQGFLRQLQHRPRADSCSRPTTHLHEYAYNLLERNLWSQEVDFEVGASTCFVDMLLLQEHKLSTAQTSRCGKVLPRCSQTYWEPLIGEQGCSGGVSTSIGASLMQYVFGHGTLVTGHALWVGLDLEGSRLGVLNIYAPMDLR